MDKHLKQLLKASLDRELTTDEDVELRSALQTSPELQIEKKRYEQVRELMKNHSPDFKSPFVANVMAKIQPSGNRRFRKVLSLLSTV
jgi:negative regulator of sigma E activity